MVGLLGQNALQNFFQNGLLGLGGPTAALGTQLPDNSMQQFYDPEAMRRYQIKRGLLGAGVGMLAQEPTIAPQNLGTQIGKGAAVGLLAADNAGQDYTQNALLASQLADQQSQREADMAHQQQVNSFLSTVPEKYRSAAALDPGAWSTQMAQNAYAQPPQPKTELTEINGHRVLVDTMSGKVIQDYGPIQADPNKAPPGYRYLPNGNLQAVPGGPADPALAKPRALTSVDKNAILESDDQIQSGQNAVTSLKRALDLNDKAGSGWWAGPQAWAARNDPIGMFDDEKGAATTEFNNLVASQALSSMKAIFGGNPTEGERKILLDLQGMADKSPEERKAIIDRAIELANRRIAFHTDRIKEIRTGKYFGDASTVQGDVSVSGEYIWTPDGGLQPK